MATYTQIGSATLDAFQWKGGVLADYTLPWWAKAIALLPVSDGTVDVPTLWGTIRAVPTDWLLRYTTGEIGVMPNSLFVTLYS